MKILLIVVFSILFFSIGFKFYLKYKKRYLFFESLVFLCQKFDVEIAFSRQRIQNIISTLDEKLKQNLSGIDKNYLSCMESENLIEKEKLFENINFLNEEEKNNIFLFFKSLGRTDLENQLKELKNYENKFLTLQTTSNNEFKKYGKLSIKLGIIACLMVVVIFL